MFRKIHSKRNPDQTLFTALGTEFRVYIDLIRIKVVAFLKAYPKQVFGFMVISILVSAVLTLTVFRSEKPEKKVAVQAAVSSAGQGFSQILSTAEALRESLQIKQEISALIAKDSLTSADSLRLHKALDRFHQLTITNNPNEPN